MKIQCNTSETYCCTVHGVSGGGGRFTPQFEHAYNFVIFCLQVDCSLLITRTLLCDVYVYSVLVEPRPARNVGSISDYDPGADVSPQNYQQAKQWQESVPDPQSMYMG